MVVVCDDSVRSGLKWKTLFNLFCYLTLNDRWAFVIAVQPPFQTLLKSFNLLTCQNDFISFLFFGHTLVCQLLPW